MYVYSPDMCIRCIYMYVYSPDMCIRCIYIYKGVYVYKNPVTFTFRSATAMACAMGENVSVLLALVVKSPEATFCHFFGQLKKGVGPRPRPWVVVLGGVYIFIR